MIEAVLLDLDGTVYKGDKLIEGADLAIENMRNQGVRVFFCTNNSSKLPSSIARKLNRMGIECTEEDVISSGSMAIKYVLEKGSNEVYISGTEELRRGFVDAGIDVCDENEARTLVIGMDPEFNYDKITKGMRAAFNARTIIICNEDRWFEKEDGLYPGNCAMTSSILHCSGRKPDLMIGKPGSFMAEYIGEKYGFSKENIMVIGDSVDSDIAMAKKFGCKYLLIGQTKEENCVKSLFETINYDWTII
ncbi:MAG: HAD-IIA family hydrolase [Thermoplasmata archaeon]|nr:HAD-IIA family hydrolase [Thermoplasmata archaeon]